MLTIIYPERTRKDCYSFDFKQNVWIPTVLIWSIVENFNPIFFSSCCSLSVYSQKDWSENRTEPSLSLAQPPLFDLVDRDWDENKISSKSDRPKSSTSIISRCTKRDVEVTNVSLKSFRKGYLMISRRKFFIFVSILILKVTHIKYNKSWDT